jgi:hypothetical protein
MYNGEFYICAKQQKKFNVLSKGSEGVYYHKLQVESLVQITFSNFQNSSKLHHEFIITSLTLQKKLNHYSIITKLYLDPSPWSQISIPI